MHVTQAISLSVSYKVTHVSFQRESQTVKSLFPKQVLESWEGPRLF